jgi:hypothetical protein
MKKNNFNTNKMQAVYQLGKIPSKYLILDIIGFSRYRNEVGALLFGTSRTFRLLLIKEFSKFIDSSVEEEIVELESFNIYN